MKREKHDDDDDDDMELVIELQIKNRIFYAMCQWCNCVISGINEQSKVLMQHMVTFIVVCIF
jgi:hypothetical protein